MISFNFAGSFFETMFIYTLLLGSMVISIAASLSLNIAEETEPGVSTGTGSGGLNCVAMMKKDRIRKAMSTNGVISVSVLFLAIFI
jgi:hypothetical protein